MRDEAGCGLMWNRHIKIMDVDGTKILQYRNRCQDIRYNPRRSRGQLQERRTLSLGESSFLAEAYVRRDLPVLEADAARKTGHDSLTVPKARPGKDEKFMFPGYDSSSLGRLAKRVTQLNNNRLRSMMETEMKVRREEISRTHYNNPQYLKNIEAMTSDLHERLLRTYIPSKRTRRARTTDGGGSAADSDEA